MKLALPSSREATKKLPAYATAAVFACLIAFQLYVFLQSLQTEEAPVSVRTRPPQKPDQASPDIGRLAASHLFGDVENIVPQYSEVKEDKSLNLTLRGIVANSGGNTSLAIIESSPNNEETFAIGDNVFNKGKLDFVGADHVILARSNGQLTKLQLPEQETSGMVTEEYLPLAQPEPEYVEPVANEPETAAAAQSSENLPQEAAAPAEPEPPVEIPAEAEPVIENQDQAPAPE